MEQVSVTFFQKKNMGFCNNVRRLLNKAWFPYDRSDRPDRPSRVKKCLNDRDNHMETLARRSQTTRIFPIVDRYDRPDLSVNIF